MPAATALLTVMADPAYAGPPYASDDPAPTEYRHWEIYAFTSGAPSHHDTGGAAGIDFNYGATPDIQLTAVTPIAYERTGSALRARDLGNVELGVKVRILHQATSGWDVAAFPRLFLPSPSNAADQHAALLLPVWIGRSRGDWSTFGGGGCALNHGGGSRNYCIAGWAVTRRVTQRLQWGGEVFHRSADTIGGADSTTLGLGMTWDASENLHLLGYAATEIQHRAENGPGAFYASALLTF